VCVVFVVVGIDVGFGVAVGVGDVGVDVGVESWSGSKGLALVQCRRLACSGLLLVGREV